MEYFNKNSNFYLSLLIIPIPIALITGPALPDILVSLTSLFFLFISLANKEYKYYNNFITKFFLIICIFLILNSIISSYSYFSLRSSLFYFRFILFSLAIWYLLDNEKKFLKNFLYGLILAYFIAIGSGIYQYIYGETIFGIETINTRLLLLSSDNAALGHFLSRLFPLLVGLLILNLNKSMRYYTLIFVLFISTDVLVYLSGERTSLALMFLSSTFILILMSKLKLFRLLTLITSFIIIIFVSFYIPEVKERNIDRTMEQIGITNDSEKIYIFSRAHENYIFTAFEMFKKNPINGLGVNNYRNFCKSYSTVDPNPDSSNDACNTHPHNIYIQLLAETGLIGFFFVMTINFFLIKLVYIHIYQIVFKGEHYLNDFQICLIACFVCSLWPVLPTLNLFNNWMSIIFYLPLGFFLKSWYEK